MHILQDKTGYQKYKVSDTAFAKLIPANFLVLIVTKFISQNLSKANDEIFLKNFDLLISASNIKRLSFLYFSDVYLHRNNQNYVCIFLLKIPLTKD